MAAATTDSSQAARSGVRFGVVLPITLGGNAGEAYEETIRVCRLAEELGFDFATVPHHRFHAKYPSSPFVLLGALAATTERIGLGTNIVVLPALHPVNVAEHIATIDHLSGGRVFIGAGTGYIRKEFEVGGFAFETRGDRMSEALQVLRLLWTQENASFAGKHFQFEDVTLQPRPVQRPNPPILVGAQMPRAVKRAARLGDGWTSDSKTTLRELAPLVGLFRQEAEAAGDGRPRTISVTRDVGIGLSRGVVEETWLPSVKKVFADYWHLGMRFPDPENVSERLARGQNVSFGEFVSDRFVAGSPDDCIASLRQVIDVVGCDQVLLRFGYGDRFDDAALRLFAKEVIPPITSEPVRR
jgi:probable F420-dependent oxidoreductase